MITPVYLLAIGVISALLAWLILFFLPPLFIRWRLLDVPNERSSHNRPTPRGGGVVIVVITVAGLLVYGFLFEILPRHSLVAYLAGAVLISSMGWLDDLLSLPAWVRFLVQGFGVVITILGIGYFSSILFPFLGKIPLGELGLPLTFLWIVGLTNAFNFMDGIDGIAGAQATVAGLGWFGMGWLSGQPLLSLMGVLIAGSSISFLGHNWPPARIFMGDVGSVFLGFTFAVLGIMAAQMDSHLALTGVLFVWPFVFDATYTFLRRLRKHENIFAAHRSHLYQRLIIAGYSHRFVTLLYSGLAVIGAILALVWSLNIPGSGLLIASCMPLLCLMIWGFVTRQEHLRKFEIRRLRV